MLSAREILLCNVKCATARERIYFISLDATASNFTMTAGHYFTSKEYFTITQGHWGSAFHLRDSFHSEPSPLALSTALMVSADYLLFGTEAEEKNTPLAEMLRSLSKEERRIAEDMLSLLIQGFSLKRNDTDPIQKEKSTS